MIRKLRVFPRIIIDFVCIGVLVFTLLMMDLFAKPHKRGFFCNDESLRHPFKDSTVNMLILNIIGVFVPISVMLIGEFLFIKSVNSVWIASAYEKISTCTFGGIVTIFITYVAKYQIGRLRPHFFALCDPDFDCTLLPEEQHIYVTNFTCRADNTKEVRLSFPSGHAAFIAYVMIYLTFYLQLRITSTGSSKLLRPFLQLICLTSAWYISMSRVSDYHHHWSDVLCGMLIGTIISFITVFYIAGFLKKNQHDSCDMMTTDALNARNNTETLMQVNKDTSDHAC